MLINITITIHLKVGIALSKQSYKVVFYSMEQKSEIQNNKQTIDLIYNIANFYLKDLKKRVTSRLATSPLTAFDSATHSVSCSQNHESLLL